MRTLKDLTIQEKEEIVSLYINTEHTFSSLAKLFNINNYQIIGRFIKNKGLKSKPNTITNRKYTINQSFFDNIDTEEKAYFLGFLYADGTHSPKRNAITLCLSEIDKEILEKLSYIIGSNKPLRYVIRDQVDYIKNKLIKRKNQYCMSIHNEHISKRLLELGCHSNKTHTLLFPEWLRPDLYHHFIRGYFDGDGSISFTGNSYIIPQLNIVSTNEFLTSVENIFFEKASINKRKNFDTSANYDNVAYLHYGGRKVILRIKDFLYKDATIFLKRKKDKFDLIPYSSSDTTS